MTLPPKLISRGSSLYVLSLSNALNADLQVSNKNSVNPISFNKEGFGIEAKNEVARVFSDYKIDDPASILSLQPRISISNDYGVYGFELTATVITPNKKQFVGTLTKAVELHMGEWTISGDMSMDLTVTLSKENGQDGVAPSLLHDLETGADAIRQGIYDMLQGTASKLQQTESVGTIVVAAIVLMHLPIGA